MLQKYQITIETSENVSLASERIEYVSTRLSADSFDNATERAHEYIAGYSQGAADNGKVLNMRLIGVVEQL